MAMYICAYETVTSQGEKTVTESKQMSEYLQQYDTELNKNLSPWKETDTVRPTFDKAKDGVLAQAQNYAEYGQKLGEHIKKVSTKIKELDTKLGQLKV